MPPIQMRCGIDRIKIPCHTAADMFSVARLRAKLPAAMIWRPVAAYGV